MLLFVIFFPIAAAILSAFFRSDKTRSTFAIAATGLTLAAMVTSILTLYGQVVYLPVVNMSFSVDGFRCLYGVVVCFMWFISAMASPQYFGHHHDQGRYYFFFLLVLGATAGVFLSADLYTTFLCFEIMSLGSYVWVVQEETEGAMAAGKTYLTIAVLGGLVTLMGLFILYHLTGTLVISEIKAACAAVTDRAALWGASICVFFGFAAKAGLFPLHIWLPKAHPVAPAPASALLSGVLTKAGIYGTIFITANVLVEDHAWGYLLLALGAITMVLGAAIAVFSTNLKFIFACSSLSQIGFITVGISMICLLGHHNALAARGTVLYMLNHSIVKLTLFLFAGVVYTQLHSLDLNDLKGFGRKKPWLHIVFLCGGCSLAGIPGFAGYLSKTLVHESLVEYLHLHHSLPVQLVEWLFLFSGGLTTAYLLKVYVALFWQRGRGEKDVSWGTPLTRIALTLACLALPVLGLVTPLADRIAEATTAFTGGHELAHAVHYFAWVNLKGVVISVCIGLVVYVLFIRRVLIAKDGTYKAIWPAWLDLEKSVYVPVLHGITYVVHVAARALCDLPDALILVVRKLFLTPQDAPEYVETEAEAPHSLADVASRITGSLSFALLMTCIGLCLMLIVIVSFAN